MNPDDPAFDPDGPADPHGLFGVPPGTSPRLAVLGVPWDATASYRKGTSEAPKAVLEASWQVDLHDLETGDPWRGGFRFVPADAVEQWNREARDADVATVNALSERVNEWVYEEARRHLSEGLRVGVLGGDHSSPFGAMKALAEVEGSFGVLHVDAHADLREAYEGYTWSHASIFHNVLTRIPQVTRLVSVGVRDLGRRERRWCEGDPRIEAWFDPVIAEELAKGTTWQELADRIVAALPDKVYVSFDIDGLSPDLCPNTGTPVPGGLSWHQATVLLRTLGTSGKRIVGFDLCEVAPEPIDAIVGARMLYKLAGWTLFR